MTTPKSSKKTKLDTLAVADGKKEKATTAKSKRGRAPKKKATKIDNISFADGKEKEAIQKAKELEELVGLSDVNPFGTSIKAVFEENLEEMLIVDLQELAVKAGVFPSGTRTSLRNKLLKAFAEHQRGSSSFILPQSGTILPNVDRNDPAFKKALKLMGEGL